MVVQRPNEYVLIMNCLHYHLLSFGVMLKKIPSNFVWKSLRKKHTVSNQQQFTIVPQIFPKYHIFSIVNQSYIVFGEVSQFFNSTCTVVFSKFITIFYSIGPLFFHSKWKSLSCIFVKKLNFLGYITMVFQILIQSFLVFGYLPCFFRKQKFHSFLHSTILFHNTSKYHSTIVQKYCKIQ